MEITLYFVGVTADDAQENFPFDSYESAESYVCDNPDTRIYSATATIDFSTMTLAAT